MEKKGKEKNINEIIGRWTKLFFFLYLFILSIELIKKTASALAPNIKDFISVSISPIKAVAAGWFTTSIAQSSGAVGTIAAAFAGEGIISLQTAIFILIGAALGTTITALIISLVTVAQKRKDFRHGFEIALCYSIFTSIIVVIAMTIEYFFGAISKTSLFILSLIGEINISYFPDIMGFLTSPITNFLTSNNNLFVVLLFSFVVLIFSIKFISKSIISVFGGEENTRKKINNFFDKKYKAYLLGVILTAVVFSSSITIGLLVPLAVSRLISLKKAIPFIIGADLGTSTDVILASLIINKPIAFATAISYVLLPIIGAIIFLPNINLLFRITKYTSKKLINISRKKAFYFLIIFIAIPLLLIFLF